MPKNEFNNVPQRVLARESQEIFTGEGWRGGGGSVDERYVTLGGVYRPALRSVTRGWGVSSLAEKSVT